MNENVAENLLLTTGQAYEQIQQHHLSYEDFEEFLMEVVEHPQTVVNEKGKVRLVTAGALAYWLGY